MGGQRPAHDRSAPGLVHDAVLYRGAQDLLAAAVPFITDGLATGDGVMVVAPQPTLALLEGALPGLADRAPMLDMCQVGRNPGAILPAVLAAIPATDPGQRIRIVGESIWARRSADEYLACVQHEAMVNSAFASRDALIRCVYDAASLPPAWLADAALTHPLIGTPGRIAASGDYGDPARTAASFGPPLPDPPATAVRLAVRLADLSRLRRLVTDLAGSGGLSQVRTGDLVVAVGELAANSIQHGGGSCVASFWITDRSVVCQVSDAGHIADPLAGRIPVLPGALTGGRGLLLVNLLCDLVRVHTAPGGTTVQVWMRR